MNCLSPVYARLLGTNKRTGKHLLSFRGSSLPDVALPCGKCAACLANRQALWRRRMQCELFQREVGSFLTLTYNDTYCPSSLVKEDVQKFLKRLRNASRDFNVPVPHFTYYAVGEYGSHTHRPHYHLALFGLDFKDLAWQPYPVGFFRGFPQFASKVLEYVWPFGFNQIGDLNSSTIGYVSKYLTKPSKSEFSLKSHSLGVAPFIDVRRVGRKVLYRPRRLLETAFKEGTFSIGVDGDVKRFGVPKYLYKYLEFLNPSLYDEVKERNVEWIKNHPLSDSVLRSARAISGKIHADNYKKGKVAQL